MATVTYMVRATSKAACQRELDRICLLLEAVPATLPTDAAGTDWVARAVLVAKAPVREDQGLGMSG